MQNVIIVVILIFIIALAVYGIYRRAKFGSSCCGSKEPVSKAARVHDKKKSHYPFVYNISVDGMHCENCARRVENAFNKHEGNWATVSIGEKKVLLRSKTSRDHDELRDIITSAGYVFVNVQEVEKDR